GTDSTTRLPPATETTLTTRPAGMSTSAVAVMLCEAPAKLMRTVPKWLAGMPTETRPVEPTMSCRLNDSVDWAAPRTLKAPSTTPAPIAPDTTPTRDAALGPRPRLWTPNSPPTPNMATNPSRTGVGDTPPKSKL